MHAAEAEPDWWIWTGADVRGLIRGGWSAMISWAYMTVGDVGGGTVTVNPAPAGQLAQRHFGGSLPLIGREDLAEMVPNALD